MTDAVHRSILEAFAKIDRKDFVLPEYAELAYEDKALPIGYGQTISQPSTVAFMLDLLEVMEGQKVLDVGSGSGWTTALLAYLVGDTGMVTGVELVSELVKFGQTNLAKHYPESKARIYQATCKYGCKDRAPYDRILVSASAEAVPAELVDQLKPNGIMVLPVQNSIWKIVNKLTKDGGIYKEEYPGFVFVPLV